MSDSFLGSYVFIQLASGGGDVQGTIVGIDGSVGSLTIADERSGSRRTLARSEIADLRIAKVAGTSATATAAPKPPQPLPPATNGVGMKDASRSYSAAVGQDHAVVARSSPRAHHAAPVANPPTAPAAMTHKGKKTTSGAAQGGKGKPYAGGKGSSTLSEQPTSDLEEDFDFDKAMKGFDKKKIWEEIKTADRRDPTSLLVSHNRRSTTATPDPSATTAKRSAQDALAWNEPVLSPGEASSAINLQSVQDELNRVRGNALQRDVQWSGLQREVDSLKSKCTMLEALLGAEVREEQAEGGHRWSVTLYESLTAYGEAKRVARKAQQHPTAGALTFLITTAGETGKLRYLGPNVQKSDAAVLQRLPPQYHNEMGLKMETASVFFRRIKDAIVL